ncbi:hypothetical protein JK182_14010 [Acetobacter okinawensis]|uniref:protelomerase family protein n=1 Tax=Acetobacter okinawensis TaxID=1076594 RepID=UPI001BAC9B09|nr:protelomerase family protein [Acetobacter okinawensis]MBS0989759.1 hypothetical protein [Acetobacter okinawensis]
MARTASPSQVTNTKSHTRTGLGRQPRHQTAIASFIKAIAGLSGKKLTDCCTEKLAELMESPLKPATIKGYIRDYRAAITNTYGSTHPALNILNFHGLNAKITAAAELQAATQQQVMQEPGNAADDAVMTTKPPSRRNAVMTFIDKIKGKSATKITQLWEVEYKSLDKLTDGTKKTVISQYYRKYIKDILGENHPALEIVRLPAEVSDAIAAGYRARVIEKNKELKKIENWRAMVDAAANFLTSLINRKRKPTINHDTAEKIGAALLLLTGRRPYEIFCTGVFTPAPLPGGARNAFSKWSLLFSGQAKTKMREGSNYGETFEIPVLAPAKVILEAADLYRHSSLGKKTTGMSNDDFSTLCRARGTAQDNENGINLLKQVEDFFGKYWIADSRVTPRDLRPLYAEIAYKFFAQKTVSKNSFFSAILGHTSKDIETSLSYMQFYLSDDDQNTAELSLKKAHDRTTDHLNSLQKEKIND